MWVVAGSCDCGDRAAGRWRWQYSGAHRCEPPLSVWLTVGSAGLDGAQQVFGGESGRWCAENSVAVHSHTLPIRSTRPNPLGGNVPPGDVPTQPRAPSLRYGNLPCHVLAINRPPGGDFSPNG